MRKTVLRLKAGFRTRDSAMSIERGKLLPSAVHSGYCTKSWLLISRLLVHPECGMSQGANRSRTDQARGLHRAPPLHWNSPSNSGKKSCPLYVQKKLEAETRLKEGWQGRDQASWLKSHQTRSAGA
ncbi:unnamed protein product [Pleuronectes platessa]|uniref:Uncharacterized protein n=1 Tax=Pleuronectes platessa TaxID=8262 RepID=A0A9N7Z4P6_PLEPL|nr:unnamed protein product [Pleuronectes platessa]